MEQRKHGVRTRASKYSYILPTVAYFVCRSRPSSPRLGRRFLNDLSRLLLRSAEAFHRTGGNRQYSLAQFNDLAAGFYATRALHRMQPRDRMLVQWMSESVPLEEQAERLDMTYAAVQRAGLRAVERFRKVYELIVSRSEG